MELAQLLAAVGAGVLIGLGTVAVYAWILYRRITAHIDSLIEQAEQEIEDSMMGLDIERHNGVYFCYGNEDRQFVCQGATVAEIRAAFQARFPDKTAYLSGGDPAVIAEFQTELSQLATVDT
jgi:hypothetical protein